ncbi:MAG: PD-(D/E)XK nuclease family protein [Planctomycetota bacterium]
MSRDAPAATSRDTDDGRRLDVWIGPPASGKTAAAIELFRGLGGRRLWLAPNAAAVRQTKVTLTASGVAVFDVTVQTFEQFCGSVIAAAAPDLRLLPAASRRRLLRDVIEQAAAAGDLPHFRPIAATPGFLRLVEANIADFKRNEIWPETLLERQGDAVAARSLRELTTIYDRYQRRLRQPAGESAVGELYDDDGRLWAAREILRRDRDAASVRFDAVVIDGFSDLSRTQSAICASLASRAGRTVVTLPDDGTSAEGLFGTAEGTRRELIESCLRADDSLVIEERRFRPRRGGAAPAIAVLADQLFREQESDATTADATGLRLLTAGTPRDEARAIAADLRRRCETGARPGEFVVAYRDATRHADEIEEAFEEAGVPLAADASRPLAGTPAVRLLRQLLELERGRWPREALTAVLGDGRVVRAYADGEEGTGGPSSPDGVAAAAMRRLREYDFDRGRDEAVRILTAESAPPAVAAWCTRFDEGLAPSRRGGTFAEWVDRLFALGRDLGFRDGVDAGWPELRDALGAAVRDEAVAVDRETAGRRVRVDRFLRLLDDVVDGVGLAPSPQPGGVRVVSAAMLRGVSVPHLYFASMTDGELPSTRSEDCLIGHADRQELSCRGLPIASADRRTRDEMALFVTAATRARETLTLCRPTTDAQGGAVFPSPYWTAAVGLFETPPPQVGTADVRSGTDEDARPVTRAERRAAAVEAALRDDLESLAAIARHDHDAARAVATVAAAARMTHARSSTRGPTAYDGRLATAASRRRLHELFPPDHVTSASRLEEFAADPFAFFLSDVLKADFVEPPGPRDDRLGVGIALHAALAAFEGDRVDTADSVAELAALITDRFTAAVRGSLFGRLLARIESRKAERWARRYADQDTAYRNADWDAWDEPPSVTCREAAFGRVPEEAGHATDPLVLGDDACPVRVSGQVDRIDLGRRDGRPTAVVIDYKTGKLSPFDDEDLASGRALQLAIYAKAATDCGLVPPETEIAQVAFWGLREAGFKPGFKRVGLKAGQPLPTLDAGQAAALSAAAEDVVPRLVAAIRAGHFVPSAAKSGRSDFASKMTAAVARSSAFRATAAKLDKDRGPLETAAGGATA